MRAGTALLAFVALAASTGCGRPEAVARLQSSDGGPAGSARLIERRGGVVVRMEVSGLPPGRHGAHIHEIANCVPPEFLSAGDHFDHSGAGHDHQDPKGHHSGDLPNLSVGPDGRGSMDAMVPAVTLSGSGAHSLFRSGGTSIVIHEDEDDQISEPSGKSGRRIACGVIVPAQ